MDQRNVPGFGDYQGRFNLAAEPIASDYELLSEADLISLLLAASNTKVDATRAIEAFGTVWNLLSAPPSALRKAGVPPKALNLLRLVRAVSLRGHGAALKATPFLNSWDRLLQHMQTRFTGLQHEEFWVLYLDRHNRLLAEERAGIGTVDHVPVYPREVVTGALEHRASCLILVHNHPSGSSVPSQADIEMTKKIIAACQPLDIVVHDHLVVGAKHFSMKTAGLI